MIEAPEIAEFFFGENAKNKFASQVMCKMPSWMSMTRGHWEVMFDAMLDAYINENTPSPAELNTMDCQGGQ